MICIMSYVGEYINRNFLSVFDIICTFKHTITIYMIDTMHMQYVYVMQFSFMSKHTRLKFISVINSQLKPTENKFNFRCCHLGIWYELNIE